VVRKTLREKLMALFVSFGSLGGDYSSYSSFKQQSLVNYLFKGEPNDTNRHAGHQAVILTFFDFFEHVASLQRIVGYIAGGFAFLPSL